MIKPFINVDPSKIKKISINTDSLERLKVHPYLRYGQAQAIYDYRIQHGSFTSLSELDRLYVFKREDFNRILPYLDVN